jgi:hypothetical protein
VYEPQTAPGSVVELAHDAGMTQVCLAGDGELPEPRERETVT